MIPITDAEWQSLLSKHNESPSFVVDMIRNLLDLGEEKNQMYQDQYGEEE